MCLINFQWFCGDGFSILSAYLSAMSLIFLWVTYYSYSDAVVEFLCCQFFPLMPTIFLLFSIFVLLLIFLVSQIFLVLLLPLLPILVGVCYAKLCDKNGNFEGGGYRLG